MGDLTAKSESQAAVALITGWLTGISLISFSHSPTFLFSAFFVLAPLHFIATRQLLLSAEFEVLNESKATLIITEYLKTERIPSMIDIKPFERFFGESVKPVNANQIPPLCLGSTLDQAFNSADELLRSIESCKGENYLIGRPGDGKIHIVLHRDAEGTCG